MAVQTKNAASAKARKSFTPQRKDLEGDGDLVVCSACGKLVWSDDASTAGAVCAPFDPCKHTILFFTGLSDAPAYREPGLLSTAYERFSGNEEPDFDDLTESSRWIMENGHEILELAPGFFKQNAAVYDIDCHEGATIVVVGAELQRRTSMPPARPKKKRRDASASTRAEKGKRSKPAAAAPPALVGPKTSRGSRSAGKVGAKPEASLKSVQGSYSPPYDESINVEVSWRTDKTKATVNVWSDDSGELGEGMRDEYEVEAPAGTDIKALAVAALRRIAEQFGEDIEDEESLDIGAPVSTPVRKGR